MSVLAHRWVESVAAKVESRDGVSCRARESGSWVEAAAASRDECTALCGCLIETLERGARPKPSLVSGRCTMSPS